MKKIINRDIGMHLIFVVSLASFASLAGWWSLFISKSVEESHESALRELKLQAEMAAIRGYVPTGSSLVIRPCRSSKTNLILVPYKDGLCIAPRRAVLERIESEHKSKQLMVTGESAVFLLLLAILLFMLYWSVLSERRFRRDLDSFFNTVTHELKTPLAGIKTFLQSVEIGRLDSKDASNLASMAVKEVDRLEHLVENLLFSSRLKRRRPGLKLRPVELELFLEELIEHRRLYSNKKGGSILLKGDETLQTSVLAAPDALRVILENLLDNADKYGNGSDVIIEVSKSAGKVEICVMDKGPGFPPERSQDLFKAFRRGDWTDDGIKHGSGLGLYLARSLARFMGGDLRAESTANGSCFTLLLKEAEK
ncbi:MAG: HAMP domain-containing histidine kinase [Deltaproteobacteria bacterium]|nr:HAMP domain-containing histidine kinase [Deltaproteobacteria bacterium]